MSRIPFDDLISDEDSKNWYNYDYESICFLINSEKMESTKFENNIIMKNSSEIYFQNKLSYVELSLIQQHKQFLVCIIVNEEVKINYSNQYTTKIAANLMSTLQEIFKKINEKLKTFNPKLCFEPESHALKVVNYKYLSTKLVIIFGKWKKL